MSTDSQIKDKLNDNSTESEEICKSCKRHKLDLEKKCTGCKRLEERCRCGNSLRLSIDDEKKLHESFKLGIILPTHTQETHLMKSEVEYVK